MPVGLRFRNSAGTVQVDETYRNLAFRERRGIALSGAAEISYHDIAITGGNVVVAMYSQYYAPVLLAVSVSGSTWTYRWGFSYRSAGNPTSDTAYLYIFDDPPAVSSAVGVRVRDAGGTIVYHSDVKPLILAGDPQSSASSFTGLSGRVYAPLILSASIFSVFGSGNFFNNTFALRAAGNVIAPVEVTMGIGSAGVSSTGLYAPVDVTGYV